MNPNDTNDTTVVDGSIMALLNGIVANGYLEVALSEDTNEITMTVRSNTSPVQTVSWTKGGSGTWIIDDTTTTATDRTWSANKINTELEAKVDEPATTGTNNQLLASDGEGSTKWIDAPAGSVSSVQGKTGVVVLTGEDINVSTTNDSKVSEAIVDVKIDGTSLIKTDNKVDIPVAGISDGNDPGSIGVVSVNYAKGLNVDSNGTIYFNANALAQIEAAYKTINAAEYDSTQKYQIGQYATYKGHFYVCKVNNTTGEFSTLYWSQTNETNEINNLLSQLLTYLGIKENARTWDTTNNKVLYNFEKI